jgi:hypothetical protein
MMSDPKGELHEDKAAAKILGVKPSTMTMWRFQKRGPAYVKIGRRVYYFDSDLQEYILAQRRDPKAA